MNRFTNKEYGDTAKDFCLEFGIAMLDAESRLAKIRPNDGEYFNKDGSKSGYMMPLYFSAVSLIIKDATNILEIGTGVGNITSLLANLFPATTIYTIDIPTSDKDYEKQAIRNTKKKKGQFIENIKGNNITYIERNSFFLPSMGLPGEFDLIYIDGGHWYPVVAWDAMFAYNSLRPGGFAFFHDYGNGTVHVEPVIKYIKGIIDEKIKLVLSSMPSKGGGAAWFRKLASEETK